ncbi:MAG: hypothetical protein GW760_08950 [Legionella sp.]|jgi:hypothetical protein|nr:hypothetical protein [Legionella sp.]
MRERSQGMILLTTLIMLALIASLLFSMMRATWIYQKLARKTQASHAAFYALEGAAQHLLALDFKRISKICIKKTRDVNQPLSILRLEQGCELSYKNQAYRYALADLGVFSCSHHWIIAVTAPELGHEILSIRVATPVSKKTKACKTVSKIDTGVLSWRYLAD